MNLLPATQTSPEASATYNDQNPSYFLQATLDSLAAHIAILDENGVIIAVNAAWNRFAQRNGYSAESYGLGANYLEVCREATGEDSLEAPIVLQGIKDVLGGRRDEFYLEYPCHSPDEKRWFSLRATRFWGEGSQNVTRVVVAHENITPRKVAENKLREESEIIETLYRVGQIVAAELDPHKIATAVTEAAGELTGAHLSLFLPAAKHLGQPYAFGFNEAGEYGAQPQFAQRFRCGQRDFELHPFERERYQSCLRAEITARNGQKLGAVYLGHPQPGVFSLSHEKIATGLCSQAALAMENALLYETAQREQAATRESETRYRFVCNMIPQIVWMTRPDGFHEFYNQQWFDYTGIGEKSYGDGWANPLHPDDIERSQKRWQHSLETGQPYEIEYRFRRHDGVYRWFLGRAQPLRDENGKILKWFGTCTDIDDAKRAEDERLEALRTEAQLRREAEEANRIKDEFLAVVSHELRTPLTPILGWMELLRNDEPDDQLRAQAYEVIERNAKSQSQIVNDLLDVSRIITGKLKLDLGPIDLVRVVESSLETVESAARAKNVALDFVHEGEFSTTVGDGDRLRQVVWNLVSNAVKFTPKNGRVEVRLSQRDSSFFIEVQDSGMGIEPEFLPYVFERFRQADASSTRRHGGLGLGLSIVRHLVEQHGGEVRVDSKGFSSGTTFTVRLPIAPVLPEAQDEEENDASSNESSPFHASRRALRGLSILVVDDEADAREIVCAILKRHGAEVFQAASAREALSWLQKSTPDLMVSDIGMPDEDGYSLIQKVRALPPENGGKIPALALTAYARAQDRAKALSSGFQTHLSKPVVSAELVVTLAALAGRTSDD